MGRKKKSSKKKSPVKKNMGKLQRFQQGVSAFLLLIILVFIPKATLSYPKTDELPRENYSLSIQLPSPAPIPIDKNKIIAPELTAKGVFIVDTHSKTQLFEKNGEEKYLPASTTKIMTALVALETFDLDQDITITEEERTIGNTLSLKRGEVVSVKNLLYGVLVGSGNDAALALALSYPKTGYSGFVRRMNVLAKELHLESSSFKNVSGVESIDHFVSAKDLSRLTLYAMQKPIFREIVGTQEFLLYNAEGVERRIKNTNVLLGSVEGVVGVKTGWTDNAGECLVTAVERDGKSFIVVVLGSEDRFGETEKLIDWVFSTYQWQNH